MVGCYVFFKIYLFSPNWQPWQNLVTMVASMIVLAFSEYIFGSCEYWVVLEHSVVLVTLVRPNFTCIINNRSTNHRALMICKLC